MYLKTLDVGHVHYHYAIAACCSIHAQIDKFQGVGSSCYTLTELLYVRQ
jgi:hypothetical protein